MIMHLRSLTLVSLWPCCFNRRDAKNAEKTGNTEMSTQPTGTLHASLFRVRAPFLSAVFASLRFIDSFTLLSRGYCSRTITEDDATYALAELDGVEIQQQSQPPATHPKLAQQFGLVHGFQGRQRPRLHHHFAADQQFHLVGLRQRSSFVAQGERPFSLEARAPEVEFMAQTCLVRRRQESWSQLPVHLHRAGYDFLRQPFCFEVSAVMRGTQCRDTRVRDASGLSPSCRRGLVVFVQTKHEFLDTLLEDCHVEIQKQRDLPAPELQIRQHLCSMYRVHHLNRLHLDYDRVDRQQIETITALQLHSFIDHWHGLLGLMCNATQVQFVRERVFVGRLRFSGAKLSMYLDSRTDDLIGEFVRLHGWRVITDSFDVNRGQGSNGARFNRRDAKNAERKNGKPRHLHSKPSFSSLRSSRLCGLMHFNS